MVRGYLSGLNSAESEQGKKGAPCIHWDHHDPGSGDDGQGQCGFPAFGCIKGGFPEGEPAVEDINENGGSQDGWQRQQRASRPAVGSHSHIEITQDSEGQNGVQQASGQVAEKPEADDAKNGGFPDAQAIDTAQNGDRGEQDQGIHQKIADNHEHPQNRRQQHDHVYGKNQVIGFYCMGFHIIIVIRLWEVFQWETRALNAES